LDKDLKIRARKIEVSCAFNGSQFEDFIQPHEIVSKFAFYYETENNYIEALGNISKVNQLYCF